jgi:hypothetical protein
MNNKTYTWAEILGGSIALIGIFLIALGIGAVLMIIPAWIGHWILVNLFQYTTLSLWQVWGILIGLRLAFGGLVTVNKN